MLSRGGDDWPMGKDPKQIVAFLALNAGVITLFAAGYIKGALH